MPTLDKRPDEWIPLARAIARTAQIPSRVRQDAVSAGILRMMTRIPEIDREFNDHQIQGFLCMAMKQGIQEYALTSLSTLSGFLSTLYRDGRGEQIGEKTTNRLRSALKCTTSHKVSVKKATSRSYEPRDPIEVSERQKIVTAAIRGLRDQRVRKLIRDVYFKDRAISSVARLIKVTPQHAGVMLKKGMTELRGMIPQALHPEV